jgi:hypothetical protein
VGWFECETVTNTFPPTGARRRFGVEPAVEFVEEAVEVGRTGLFVAFEREQPLQPGGALVGDAAIGAFVEVAMHFAGGRLREPVFTEVVEQPLCLLAVHTYK